MSMLTFGNFLFILSCGTWIPFAKDFSRPFYPFGFTQGNSTPNQLFFLK